MIKSVIRILADPLLRLVAICALPVVVCPLLEWLAVARFGSQVFLWINGGILLMGVLALLISPVWLFSHEGFRVPTLIGGGVFVVAVFVGTLIGMPVRTTAFHRLAARSAPLVLAIRAYDTKYGQPPPDLAALVPEYFPSVPGTGMGAYPNYRYLVGKPAASYAGNPWVLVVSTPSGGINFDCFLYFPLQNYPETGYGGWLERMAGWAYVHE